MKRVRPPQPGLAIRVTVAERKYCEAFPFQPRGHYFDYVRVNFGLATRLKWLLSRIFEDGESVVAHDLHHDPALILRPYDPSIEDVAARYTPNANDPDSLVYLPKDVH